MQAEWRTESIASNIIETRFQCQRIHFSAAMNVNVKRCWHQYRSTNQPYTHLQAGIQLRDTKIILKINWTPVVVNFSKCTEITLAEIIECAFKIYIFFGMYKWNFTKIVNMMVWRVLQKKTIGSGTAQNLITRNECKQMNRRNKNWGLQLTCMYV